jgi:hypothetical protein
MTSSTEERGTLRPGRPHPAARSALAWIRTQPLPTLLQWQEAFASTALEGNFAAEVYCETLRRLLEGEPVSDRYLLGLVWVMREAGG